MKIIVAALASAVAAGWPARSHANLIVNGGFEGGVFLSTLGGGANEAPVGWTPDAGYDVPGNYNSVTTYNPRDGRHDLLLGNDPFYPLASLSQGFTTVRGAVYRAGFEVADVRPTGFLEVMIDGAPQATVVGPSFDMIALGNLTITTTFAGGRTAQSTPSSFQQYILESFDFVGTGYDSLTLAAANDEASYQVDDVDVSLVPEPSGALLESVGCGILLLVAPRRSRRPG